MARSSEEWVDYFRWNCSVPMRIPWYLGQDLTSEEKVAIAHSIAQFQLGESGEGRHLMRYAREWAEAAADAFYPRAVAMLIAEEQRHSRVLGRFMEMNQIPRLRRGRTDGVFRRLRHAFENLEVSISVLVSAEIIAKVYYPALREATDSPLLRAICDQIMREEIEHVNFQTQQLGRLRMGRPRLMLAATTVAHRLLFYTTAFIVGISHRRALRRGGLTFRRYWSECRREFLAATIALVPGKQHAARAETKLPLLAK